MSIGSNIRKIRKTLERSQESVIHRINNLSQSTLSNIENGKTPISPDSPLLQQLAEELGVPDEAFFSENGHTFNNVNQQGGQYVAQQFADQNALSFLQEMVQNFVSHAKNQEEMLAAMLETNRAQQQMIQVLLQTRPNGTT